MPALALLSNVLSHLKCSKTASIIYLALFLAEHRRD